MIAALYVSSRGIYTRMPGVDAWPESRDATRYQGPYPVVAHPPCGRWCRLAGLVEARWGHARGVDGGLFACALADVRRWGGVLEHPAHSAAWSAFGLPAPHRSGGWQRGMDGGWAAHVEQARYGHRARKETWLYYYSAGGYAPPADLRWGNSAGHEALVSWCRNRTTDQRPRLWKREASATPPEFAAELVRLAIAAAGPGCDGGERRLGRTPGVLPPGKHAASRARCRMARPAGGPSGARRHTGRDDAGV